MDERDPLRKVGQVLHLRPEASAATSGVASGLSSSELFGILWNALADILGTAAAATLLRRAAQRAVTGSPELSELVITRQSLEYGYTLPGSWKVVAPTPRSALCELARELWTLLTELTGAVVVQRLARIPALREHGLVPSQPEGPS